MFSSNKKSKNNRKKEGKPNNDMMNMFGLGMDMDPIGDDDDDEGLEAELAALQGRPAELHELVPDEDEEVQAVAKPKPQPTNSTEMSGVALVVSQRLEMYTQAQANAKEEGASSKVRRLDRGIKELTKLLKDARAGKSIKEDDIPPPVAVKAKSSAPSSTSQQHTIPDVSKDVPMEVPKVTPSVTPMETPQEQPPKVSSPSKVSAEITDENSSKSDDSNAETLKMLRSRRDQYKMAALAKKRDNDIQSAKHFLAVSKQFEPVIAALENGQAIDLSKLPPPPGEMQVSAPAASSSTAQQPQAQESTPSASAPAPKSSAPGPPPAPSNVLDALQQRFEKYQQAADQAKEEGNGSKARRMGRVAKQYQDAIRDHKRGKAVNFDELPTPPGFAPIPGTKEAQSGPPSEDEIAAIAATLLTPDTNVTSSPKGAQAADKAPEVEVKAGNSANLSRNQKELQFLLSRQKEFKVAALHAKKSGDIDAAKNYLRQAKGMDEMIVAAQSGLRVDITTVPSLKVKEKKQEVEAKDDFEHIQSVAVSDDVASDVDPDSAAVYSRLETALRKQIKTSEANANHYKLLGDLAAAKNFDTLHRASQQDLDTVIMLKTNRHAVPKFHYEMKSFPIVKSHPELSDSELEINIIRCINIPLPSGYQPKDMYTYVNYEFPFPSDSPQTGSTSVVKNTINPEFDQVFKVTIDRKNRSLTRVLRRQPLNFKISYQRGFLKSDKPLGQANIKLEQFNNKSTIHECIDLMDVDRGRRAVGGKIEVMLKLRQPLVDKDVEVVNERWLVLDSHLRSLEIQSAPISKSPATQRATTSQYQSLEVSKFERDVTEKQIAAIKAQGKGVPSSLLQKLEHSKHQIVEVQSILKQGGEPALIYMKQLKSGMDIEKAKAQKCLETGDKAEAKMCLARRKLLEKEHMVMMDELLSYQFGGFGC
eukprot:gene4573-5174_t